MNWYKTESTEYPILIDTTSSKKYNYMRRNVVQVEREDRDGNIIIYYEYEECKVLKEEWGIVQQLIELTPYTETKTAYYLEKEKTFYDVPNGNLTVYFDNYNGSYSVSRIANRVTVSFDTLTESTNITISVN